MVQHDNFCCFSAVLVMFGNQRVSFGVHAVQVNHVMLQSVFKRFKLSFKVLFGRRLEGMRVHDLHIRCRMLSEPETEVSKKSDFLQLSLNMF
jgi:hypothetical protein